MKNTSLLLLSLFAVVAAEAASASSFRTPNPEIWYRLDTRYNGTDDRVGRCIQYYPADSEHPDMLWSAFPMGVSEQGSDYQYFRFEEDASNPGHYAMICKAAPEGYVNPRPTAVSAAGRWTYVEDGSDASASDKYGFVFVTTETMSGIDELTGNPYCAITTDDANGWCMNCGSAKVDYAINLWYETYSEDANEWSFCFVERMDVETVGVQSVFAEDAERSVYYDLTGRAVENPGRGLYVVNGRKVFVR